MENVQLATRPGSLCDERPPTATLTTDVAIIGGGLAGSLAGAMLGRAGIDCIVIDPNEKYPADFRCEKLDGDQVKRLQKTGLANEILARATPDVEAWIARMGIVVDKRPGDQYGIFYAPLVNRVRELIPPSVRFCYTKARSVVTSEDRQTLTLSDGTAVSARLAILSNGLSVALRDKLGLTREVLSRCHSITIGFNMTPKRGHRFACPAITYYAKSPADLTALITVFPIGACYRANLFVYRSMEDPWLSAFRKEPEKILHRLMPELETMMGSYVIQTPIQIRPADLFVSHGHVQPGLVLVGDAYATACPASGNGARKVITDVERLCSGHIPEWLSSPGMGVEKIARFYADPVKQACDRFSLNKAFYLKKYSTSAAWPWSLRRAGRFVIHLTIGLFRRPLRRPAEHRDLSPSIVPTLPE